MPCGGYEATGEASLAVDVARELESARDDRLCEPWGDEAGTGRALEGDGVSFAFDMAVEQR